MRYLFIFSILLLSFISCIYSPSTENFVEIDKDIPAPEITDRNIDLNADTLFVWKYTRFNYDLSAGNAKIHSSKIICFNDTLRFESGHGSFEVNPATVGEGTFKVKIEVSSGSGTGSIADKLGGEGYEFNREWVLVVEKPKIPELKITPSIENGYLKFSWNKVDKPYFRSYRLIVNDNGAHDFYSREYKNHDITSFVDSTYVGGNITFKLSVNYYDENNYEKWTEKQISYDFPINIKFKENKDSLTISWNYNPFRCSKSLIANNGSQLFEIKSDTTFTIAAQGLGGLMSYDLIFKPTNKSQWSTNGFHNYAQYSLGVNDGIKHSNVEYNRELKAYFFKHEMSTKSANHIFETTGAYNYSWDYSDNNSIEFSKDGSKIYTTVNGYLMAFSPKMELLNSEKLPTGEIGFNTIRVVKSLDDRVFLIGADGVIFLYDIIDHKVIAKTPTMYGVSSNFKFSVSADGNYVAFINDKLYVYEIRNKQELILRHQVAGSFYGCFFAPNDPNKLILNTPENIRIFNCSSGSDDRIIDRFYANPINIDPVTHNMLLVSNSKKKIYVYDYESDKLILEMNHHGISTDFKLLNNNILVNSGFHFDISSYVNK